MHIKAVIVSMHSIKSPPPSEREHTMFTLTRDDFRIQPSNFDLTQGSNVLRIICGAFMFPHIAGKFANGAFNPGTLGFFGKAGLTPPEFWLGLAAFSELAVGILLVLGLCTRFAALGSAAVLLLPPMARELQVAAVVLAAVPMLGIYPILAQKHGHDTLAAAAQLGTTVASFTLTAFLFAVRQAVG